MPIDLTTLPEALLQAAAMGDLVPFIGSGISLHAITKNSKPFPTWEQFLHEMMELARSQDCLNPAEQKEIRQIIKRGQMLMAAQALKDSIPHEELEEYIKRRFTLDSAEPGPIHRALVSLRTPLIMTTNYDLLLEKAYAEVYKGGVAEVATPDDAHTVQRVLKSHQKPCRPLIFKIHGTAHKPDEVAFAERDYQSLMYGKPGYRQVISSVFVTKVVLMMGFSFSDPEIAVLTETLRQWFRKRSSHDYIVLPKGRMGRLEKKRLKVDFGLEVIEYKRTVGHPELVELIEYLAAVPPFVEAVPVREEVVAAIP